MQYVVVIEYPDEVPSVIGPFATADAAETWAQENDDGSIPEENITVVEISAPPP